MTKAFMKDTALTIISRRAGKYLSDILCMCHERLMSLFIVSAVCYLFSACLSSFFIGISTLLEMLWDKSSTVNVSSLSWSSKSERL